VENYSFGSPYWKSRDVKSEPKVVAVLKTNLKDVAQYYHAQAQRTKSPADYEEAAKWYRSFIRSFPDDPESAATNFLLAEALFEGRQYLAAGQEYEHTAYGYGIHGRAADAGYAAPLPRTQIPAPGENILATLKLGVYTMRRGEYISDHDVKIANWVARVMCGGEVTPGSLVSERYLLDLEREGFLSLCGEKKTQERIAHTLKTGKPLRN